MLSYLPHKWENNYYFVSICLRGGINYWQSWKKFKHSDKFSNMNQKYGENQYEMPGLKSTSTLCSAILETVSSTCKETMCKVQ